MNALRRLFLSEEKQALNYLVALALSENKLSPEDIKVLQAHIDFLAPKYYKGSLERAVPGNPFIRFQMIYMIEENLMTGGALTDYKINIMTRLFSFFQIKTDRLRELIQYLKMNIDSNRNPDQVYQQLAYLLKPVKAS